MLRSVQFGAVAFVLCASFVSRAWSADPGTAFTYQGRLVKDDMPVNDVCTFTFGLWDASAGGSQKGTSPQGPFVIVVVGGVFTRNLDFGSPAIDGTARWMEISVQCSGDGSATLLTPRQELKPAPLALSLPGLYTLQSGFSPSLIGGRFDNVVTSGVAGATIAGGGAPMPDVNRVTDTFGTVVGGCTNRAGNNAGTANDAQFATVLGGFRNTAASYYSTVAGGTDNLAGGQYSFAAGRRARVRDAVASGDIDGDQGTFTWADSTNADFTSTGPDQFLVRAFGGMYLGATGPVSIPPGTFINTSTGASLSSGGTWTNSSDREAKNNIRPVEAADVLARVVNLPIARWNYKQENPSTEHIGPMAQDFHEAFGLGNSEKSIATIDADGVALAAIQGLHQIVTEKDCEIAELKAEIGELRTIVDRLAAAVDR